MRAAEGEQESVPVRLFLYDLSMGMAKTYSPMILGAGRSIEAIYHSSIVIFGAEYYFGQGISMSPNPGKTPYGTPIKEIELGRTIGISKKLFLSYLDWLSHTLFPPHAYHLLDQNCNHFTRHLVQFLLPPEADSLYPSEIDAMMKVVMQSGVADMLRPFLDGIMRPPAQDSEALSFNSDKNRDSNLGSVLFPWMEEFRDFIWFKSASWPILESRLASSSPSSSPWLKIARGEIPMTESHVKEFVAKDLNISNSQSLIPVMDAIRLSLLPPNPIIRFDANPSLLQKITHFIDGGLSSLNNGGEESMKPWKGMLVMGLRILGHAAARSGVGFQHETWLKLVHSPFSSFLLHPAFSWSFNHYRWKILNHDKAGSFEEEEDHILESISFLCHFLKMEGVSDSDRDLAVANLTALIVISKMNGKTKAEMREMIFGVFELDHANVLRLLNDD